MKSIIINMWSKQGFVCCVCNIS